MKQTPFACFGLVLIRNIYDEGETVNVEIYTTSNNIHYITEGFEMKDGVQTHVTGILGNVQQQLEPGSSVVTMHDNYTVWCYTPIHNRGFIPEITSFELGVGSETQLPSNTKLFLCRGSLQASDKTITGPTQVRIQTSDTRLTALTHCYGLIIS